MQTSTPGPAQNPTTRRGLLQGLLGFSIGATLLGVLAPILGYLWPPTQQTTASGGRVRAASLTELQAAGGLVTAAENEPIILTYTENAGVKAFSAICTHLGCIVQWNQSGFIQSPCHDGRFNAQTGAVISGPPPSPLPAFDVVVEGDDIYVVL